MITVTLTRAGDTVTHVRAHGHSGLAESGSDVLCAAVSALVQTAYLAAAKRVDGLGYTSQDSTGLFEFSLPADHPARHELDVIIDTMAIGLKDLSSGYPHNLRLEEA